MQATCNNLCVTLAQDRFDWREWYHDMGGNQGNRHLIAELESGNRVSSDRAEYRFSFSYFLPSFPCSGHIEELSHIFIFECVNVSRLIHRYIAIERWNDSCLCSVSNAGTVYANKNLFTRWHDFCFILSCEAENKYKKSIDSVRGSDIVSLVMFAQADQF